MESKQRVAARMSIWRSIAGEARGLALRGVRCLREDIICGWKGSVCGGVYILLQSPTGMVVDVRGEFGFDVNLPCGFP